MVWAHLINLVSDIIFNYTRGTITEQVVYNDRKGIPEVSSKLHNVVVLRFPLKVNATWEHETTIDGKKYWLYAQITEYDGNFVKVTYQVPNVTKYHNETYFEERTFEVSYGMTTFGSILAGPIDMTGVDMNDENAVNDRIANNMFGYGLNKDSATN